MHADYTVPTAPRRSSRERGLGIICFMIALLGSTLLATIGPPRPIAIPERQPSGIEVELLLRSPGPDEELWALSVASWIVWLVWAWLVATVALRVVVVFAERVAAGAAWGVYLRAASDRLTLPLVRRAVDTALAGVVLARVASTLTSPPTAVAEARNAEVRLFDPAHTDVDPRAEEVLGDVLYTVKPGDSLGKIAEYFYGDWTAYERIYAANQARVQPDGRFLEDTRTIFPGWTLLVPGPMQAVSEAADGQLSYVVKPGDTLSSIAAHMLGDQTRWPELFNLNAGIAQLPDGRTLSNPQVIWPGLRLKLPRAEVASASLPGEAIRTSDPLETVIGYYQLLGRGDKAGAAELMRGGPRAWQSTPGFELPQVQLLAERTELRSMDRYERQAVVTVELETTSASPGESRRYTVSWQLARGPDGWRLVTAEMR